MENITPPSRSQFPISKGPAPIGTHIGSRGSQKGLKRSLLDYPFAFLLEGFGSGLKPSRYPQSSLLDPAGSRLFSHNLPPTVNIASIILYSYRKEYSSFLLFSLFL